MIDFYFFKIDLKGEKCKLEDGEIKNEFDEIKMVVCRGDDSRFN